MKTEVKVPAVGESISEGTIAEWTKKDGEMVKRDDVLLVLETDKASVEVVAEADGVLKTKAKAGDVVKIGAVVGEIDSDAAPSASAEQPKAEQPSAPMPAKPPPPPTSAKPAAPPTQPKAFSLSKAETMSPSVRRIVAENNLQAETISGTGKDGRLTKADALSASAAPRSVSKPMAPAPSPMTSLTRLDTSTQDVVREPMSTIRRRIAERLVEAQQTAAILTTFNEIDMTNVMALRKKYKESFEKRYGIGLGFMGFFVKAVIEALRAYPRVNAFIEGSEMIFHNYYNVGVAVGTEKGLMVPVLKRAEHMSLAEIEMAIKGFAQKARDGKISIDDLSGGTFTISNGGVYGSLMSTPILNPPQSGILGMHKIEERPMALNGQVVIRPMMYVALSYDHRIIDGSESVSFLVRVKECIEDPNRMLLEI